MTGKIRNIVTSVVFILFGAFMVYVAQGIKTVMKNDAGSGYVPKFIGSLIVVVAVAKLIISLLSKDPSNKEKDAGWGDRFGGIGTIVLMVLYMIALEPVGFLVSTTMYLFLQILLLSDKTNRKPGLFAIVSLVTSGFVYLLFNYVIQVPMPNGILSYLGL